MLDQRDPCYGLKGVGSSLQDEAERHYNLNRRHQAAGSQYLSGTRRSAFEAENIESIKVVVRDLADSLANNSLPLGYINQKYCEAYRIIHRVLHSSYKCTQTSSSYPLDDLGSACSPALLRLRGSSPHFVWACKYSSSFLIKHGYRRFYVVSRPFIVKDCMRGRYAEG